MGATDGLGPLPAGFAENRLRVHGLAEHVLCVVRYAAIGRVGLAPAPGGVATPAFDGRVAGLRGVELFDAGGGTERRERGTTLRAAAAFFGVAPGVPPLWTPTTTPDLDADLSLDPDAVAALAGWFGFVQETLEAAFPGAPATLWPEHFDLAVTVDEHIYGGSPGDAQHAEPYLYVVPASASDTDGDARFWNEPFGAGLAHRQITGLPAAQAFFVEARSRLGATKETER